MPRIITVRGTRILLKYPPEAGIKNDLIACLIRNDYGVRRSLGEIRSILDVGANIGLFCMAARQSYPDAVIHAYEPNPRIIPYLTSNTSQLRITVYGEAIGETSGFAEMLDQGDSNLATTHLVPTGAIEQTSFSSVIERMGGQVDLIKMDCEGAEWELFKDRKSWRQIRNVRMEYHLQGHSYAELLAVWDSLGFEVIHHAPSGGFGIIWATAKC